MGTLQELAAQREAEWLAVHGVHEYESHDLIREAEEKIADAWNYLKREMDRDISLEIAGGIGDAILGIANAWDDLQWVRQWQVQEGLQRPER